MNRHPQTTTNLEALEHYWRRSSFHDELIEEVAALNKRVLIRLTHMTLVVTGATDLKQCELPADWLDCSIVRERDRFILDVETDSGHIKVTGTDVRLIRNSDLAMLIPPVDA
jgi:hypothetical protein